MPDPAAYDSESDWMAACVPTRIDEGDDQDQAVAVCLNMWRNKMVEPMEGRAYGKFHIKAVVNETERRIEGVASTPTTDRIGDVLEPKGAEYTLPMPLLWQHNHDEPVGYVTEAKATSDGIQFKAQLAKISEPGALKESVDKAWQAVKSRLVRGVSVGFRAKDFEPMKDGGLRFKKWDWFELSLVTIPANMEASISVIKSFDRTASEAASSQDETASQSKTEPLPGVTGRSNTSAMRLEPVRLRKMAEGRKPFAEQIRDMESTRSVLADQMEGIMSKAVEEGRSTDVEEQEQFDELEVQIKQLDADLKRLRTLESLQVAKAAPVVAPATVDDASRQRAGVSIQVRDPELPPGIGFARYVRCFGLAKGNLMHAEQIALAQYPNHSELHSVFKAPVAAGTTSHATWAGPLVGTESSMFADFVEYLRPQTILGKFGNGGVPSLRRIPFRTRLVSQDTGGAGYWVGEATAKPLTKFDFSSTTLEPLKVANIVVATMELLRDSSPSAAMILRDQLAAALRARMDTDFIDPTKTATPGVSPASITNGISLLTSAGNDADSVRRDVQALMTAFAAANNPPTTGVWIMNSETAIALSLAVNALGQPEFPGITMNGGTFFGLPVIVSEYVATVQAGSPASNAADVYLINASDVYFADEGGIAIDMSTEASLEMDDAPSHEGSTPTAASLVSLWQTNMVGFRAERTLNWSRRRDEGVQGIDNVQWGQ